MRAAEATGRCTASSGARAGDASGYGAPARGARATPRPYGRRPMQRRSWHAVVADVPSDDGLQVGALFRMESCSRRRSSDLTSFSLACHLLRIVCRSTVNRPFRVLAQLCVKPRKLKVSGLPPPRPRRFCSAKRPNSISRVLSGCSSRPNFANRSRSSIRKRSLRPDARIPQRSRRQSARRSGRPAPASSSIAGPRGRTRNADRRWPGGG